MFYINGTKNETDIEKIEESGMLQKRYNSEEEIEAICKLKAISFSDLEIVNESRRLKMMKG